MINRAQYQYIKEVLGVSQVMVPEGFVQLQADSGAVAMSSPSGTTTLAASVTEKEKSIDGTFAHSPNPEVRVQIKTQSFVAVLSNQELNPAQKQLASNILKAVSIENPSFAVVSGMCSETVQLLEQALPARWFVYFEEHFEKYFGTIEKYKSSQVLFTYNLDTMLEGESTEIQNFKRHVWQHIKLFSRRWEKGS